MRQLGWRARWPRTALHACSAVWLGMVLGCSSAPGSFVARLTEDGRLLADGPSARMTAEAVASDKAREVPVLYMFAIQAGEPIRNAATTLDEQQKALMDVRAERWSEITRAGQAYIDRQCYRFLTALNDLERTRKRTLENLNTVQSATVGIMGLARAAQQAIGYVGISFGLVASLFDTTVSSYLYQLPASGVAGIVNAQRNVLLADNEEVLARIRSQAGASARLTEYIAYCTPFTIEANIGKVLGNAHAKESMIEVLPVTAAVTPALAQGVEFKESGPLRLPLLREIKTLTAGQFLRLANLMLPRLATREPNLRQRLRPFIIPSNGPFTDSARAATFVTLWAETDNVTPARQAEWSAALSNVR